MKRRKGMNAKKTLGIAVAAAFLVSSFYIPGNVVKTKASGYGLSNPTIKKDVVISGDDSENEEGVINNPLVKATVTTWDCVYFGNYWQNDTNGDGTVDQNDEKQPIKWRVLSVDGDDAFLLADQNLDCQPYNEEDIDVTWETCTLRNWLNSSFLNNAFSAEEQSAIKNTIVVNDGRDTIDKVYLLSIAEASDAAYGFDREFERSSETRKAKDTAYTTECGTDVPYNWGGDWWLRSPGYNNSGYAAIVSNNGYGNSAGSSACYYNFGIRPTLHLNLSSSTWKEAERVTVEEISSSTWDCISFGNYWQSDTNSDGTVNQNDEKQPIKWRVLSVEGDDALLLADQNLDCQPYNVEDTDVTWETCTLRNWLNSTFLQNAFSSVEQSEIQTTTVVNDDNLEYGTKGGKDTTDKVYLLSIAEASRESYGFDSMFGVFDSSTRETKNTAYTTECGVGNGSWCWWLRSPGRDKSRAASVDAYGCGDDYGDYVSAEYNTVRPALHLNLSSSVWKVAGKVTVEEEDSSSDAEPTPTAIPTEIVKPTVKPTPTPDLNGGAKKYTVGKKDRLSSFWTAFSEHYKLENNTTTMLEFECFGGFEYFCNYAMIFSKEQECSMENCSDTYMDGEYAIIRGDKWGWSYPYQSNMTKDNTSKWGEEIQYTSGDNDISRDEITEIMKTADVTLKISRKNNVIELEEKAVSKADASKSFCFSAKFYVGVRDENRQIIDDGMGDVYFTLTVDHSYLNIKSAETVMNEGTEPTPPTPTTPAPTPDLNGSESLFTEYAVGKKDRTSGFWTAFSEHYKLENNTTTMLEFECFGGFEYFCNYAMIFSKEQECSMENCSDTYMDGEYAIIRGDKWGWSYPYQSNMTKDNTSKWGEEIQYTSGDNDISRDEITEIMKTADVTLKISRKNNVIELEEKAISKADASKSFCFSAKFYVGVRDENGQIIDDGMGDVYFTLTVDHSYLNIKSAETVINESTDSTPTWTSEPTPTAAPTETVKPTEKPTPTPTMPQAGMPTQKPTPTVSPLPDHTPSSLPTISPLPDHTPSSSPTISPLPNHTPSPSAAPSGTEVKKAVIKSVKNKKGKKAVIRWKKVKGASGYQIAYAVNKKFKKKKTKSVTKTTVTLKKLKKKKTYYIKVRAYKKIKGEKVYGKWSNVKKVKIKK